MFSQRELLFFIIYILINKNEVFDGIAATPIVHHPINASLLYTDGNTLYSRSN